MTYNPRLWDSIRRNRPAFAADYISAPDAADVAFTVAQRGSAATYYNSSRVLTSVTGDTKRKPVYTGAGRPRGLMIEGASQNKVLQSDDLANAAFTSGVVSVASGQTSPRGTTTATLITATAGAGNHQLYQDIAAPVAGQNNSVTAFMKRGSTRYGMVGDSGDSAWHTVLFDFDTASIANLNGASGRVLEGPDANGFYRIECTFTRASAAGTARPFVAPVPSVLGTPGYTAAGTETIIADGLQFEQGALWSSSYVPTGAATVTRSVEIYRYDPTLFNVSEGTWLLAMEINKGIDAATNYGGFAASNAGFTQSSALNISGSALKPNAYAYNGPDQWYMESTAINPYTQIIMAVTFKDNRARFSLGGAQVGAIDTACTPPPGTTLYQLGRYGTAQYAEGCIAAFAVFPHWIDDNTIDDMTRGPLAY